MTTTTSLTNKKTETNHYYALLVISLCGAFLFYKYVLQIYPSIITNLLMEEFHLTGAGLGNLAATFYYSYLIMQLFAGILLDKYNVRLLSAAAVLISALGLFVFAQTHYLMLAQLARAAMGIGVAFATVAYMKMASMWFAPKYYALVGGFLATAAMAGAVFGEAPLAWLVNQFGWRESLTICGIGGFILAALFLLFIKYNPATSLEMSREKISWSNILSVLKNKQNWLLTLYSGLAFSPIAIFGGLWGTPFLQEAYHVSKTEAASLLSLVFIGLGLGSPILGALSDRLGKRRSVMFYATLIGFFALSLVIYWETMPAWLLGVALFIFGFSLGVFMLSFAIGKEINSLSLTATVIAMINTSDAILDAVSEPLIGKILDLMWDGKMVNGVRYFVLHDYKIALSLLPIYLALATILLLFVKDKKVSAGTAELFYK